MTKYINLYDGFTVSDAFDDYDDALQNMVSDEGHVSDDYLHTIVIEDDGKTELCSFLKDAEEIADRIKIKIESDDSYGSCNEQAKSFYYSTR